MSVPDSVLKNQTPSILRTKSSLYLFVLSASVCLLAPFVFTTLAPYDDEGYVMMTIQSFLAGSPLYTSTHTQYGPGFYLFSDWVHGTLGLPITQEVIRWKTILIGGLVANLIAAITWRVSGSRWAAGSVAVLSILHLDKLALEPGHPQEVAMIASLVALCLYCFQPVSQSKRSYQTHAKWIVIGLLCGLAGMIKLNCGVVIAIPILIAVTTRDRVTVMVRMLSWSALLFPLALLWMSREQFSGMLLPFEIAVCAGFAAIGLHRMSHGHLRSRGIFQAPAWMLVVVGGIVSTAVSIGFALNSGTTNRDLIWGLFTQHSGFTSTFYHPVIPATVTIVSVLVCGVIAFRTWGFANKSQRDPQRLRLIAAAGCLILTGFLIGSTGSQPLQHGLQPRGAANFLTFLSPLLAIWLLQSRSRSQSSRIAIAYCCLLWPLLAFPTPGTQLSIGSLPALLALGTLLGDLLHWLHQTAWETRKVRSFASLTIATVTFICVCPAVIRWTQGESLGIRGTTGIRLERRVAQEQRDIAQAINESASDFLAFDGHNHNRFFFWTNKKPLTAANPTFWPRMLRSSEIRNVQQQLNQHSQVCVVVPPECEKLWGGLSSEIRDSLHQELNEIASVGHWQIYDRVSNQPVKFDERSQGEFKSIPVSVVRKNSN